MRVVYNEVTNIHADEQLIQKIYHWERSHVSFTEKIIYALNNKMHIAGIACNFAKVFDCVSKAYAHGAYFFIEFKVHQVSGLNHIFMKGNKT
jgi:hypothetical protein